MKRAQKSILVACHHALSEKTEYCRFKYVHFLELVKTLCSSSVLEIVGKCEGSKHGPEMKKLKLTL